MNTLTYKEAYNLVIEAYFKDEIKPMDAEFCFCGTLSHDVWWGRQDCGEYPYSVLEYKTMEFALFNCKTKNWGELSEKEYEEALFNGMCAALEVLKDIHRERGEDVDNEVVFKKRELKLA